MCNVETVSCDNCDKGVNYRVDGTDYCEDCFMDNFSSCEDCSDTIDNDSSHYVCEKTLCESCLENSYTKCDRCHEYDSNDNTRQTAGGSDICDSCYENYYSTCENCEEVYNCDDMWSSENGCYCSDCKPSGELNPDYFYPSKTCERVGSLRTFGVELETQRCDDYCEIDSSIPFNVCDDGSIDGKEFVSLVLSSDKGLDAISDICEFASEHNWKVNSDCGFHLHIGAQDLTRYQIADFYKACHRLEDAWFAFVPKSRQDNRFCAKLNTETKYLGSDRIVTVDDKRVARITDAIYQGDSMREVIEDIVKSRYYWVNLAAYGEHKTIEIRLHAGTLNGKKINHWVCSWLRLFEYVLAGNMPNENATLDEQFQFLCNAWGNDWQGQELQEHYAARAAEFGQPVKRQTLVAVSSESEASDEIAFNDPLFDMVEPEAISEPATIGERIANGEHITAARYAFSQQAMHFDESTRYVPQLAETVAPTTEALIAMQLHMRERMLNRIVRHPAITLLSTNF